MILHSSTQALVQSLPFEDRLDLVASFEQAECNKSKGE